MDLKFLNRHLVENNVSYFQHMKIAAGLSITLTFSGMLCLIHAIFPFLFSTTATDTASKIYHNHVKKEDM